MGAESRYSGYSEFLDFWGEWLAAWEEYVYTVVDYVDCGPTIIANVELRATGPRGGQSINWRVAQACEVREGKIVRVAGTGHPGTAGLDGPPEQAELNQPHGVFFDRRGRLHITDSSNNRILRIDP